MAKAGRRAGADFATADADLRPASVVPLLGYPDRMIERLQWVDETLDFASLMVGQGMHVVWIRPARLARSQPCLTETHRRSYALPSNDVSFRTPAECTVRTQSVRQS
jgi:hypothetical protein